MADELLVTPLEPILGLFAADADLMDAIGDQLGTTHKFGDAETQEDRWDIDVPGLTVRLDGGLSQSYLDEQPCNVECLAIAQNYGRAFEVYNHVKRIVRATKRTPVAGGLIYALSLATGPTELVEQDLNLPAVMFFLNARVSETRITS